MFSKLIFLRDGDNNIMVLFFILGIKINNVKIIVGREFWKVFIKGEALL